ncbi:multidrug efflux RND transporter permease subunit [bacterium]|nr:multidrug efflux RND transporter permease subunit [bacterium]
MGAYFVHRPVFAMVISIVVVILGVVSMGGLPVSQYPNITPPEIEVSATYTGANAVAVEQSVATPLEQKINGVENMIYMKSTNASDGSMKLRVAFEVGTDQDMANVLTQNRVSEAMSSIPEEVTRLGVPVKKALSFPLMLITLDSPNGTYDSNFLANYMTINVIDRIARLQGVGSSNLFGGSEYAMRVWIKPDQLAKLNLTVADISQAMREQNVITPAGKLGAEPAPPGTEYTYTVQMRGRLTTQQEFEEVIIRSNDDGSQVLLRDVARIELGAQNYASLGRFNGNSAAVLAIYQLPGANGLALAEKVRSTMAELEASFPPDLRQSISLDTTKAVEAGIDEILSTLFEAIVLVILVVFLFLQSWRATLIPLIAIPVSLIGTFAVFPLLGFSINTISLLGLVLAIGTVVDDAIVVVESVSLKLEQGLAPKEATVETMREVAGPILATSLSLVAVFVPVGFMAGITGMLYQQFAITIAVSVMFSSLNALTLSPALASLVLKKEEGHRESWLSRFFDRFNTKLDLLTGHYVSLSTSLIVGLRRSLLIMVSIVIAVVLLGRTIPGGFMPEEDQGYFLVNAQLPDAASMQRTDAAARKIEGLIQEAAGVASVTTVTGFSLLSGALISNNAFFFVSLQPWAERGDGEHVRDILRKLNGTLAAKVPEALAFGFGPPAIPGLGTGSGFSIFLQDKLGKNPEYLATQTKKFIQAATARPEISKAFTTFQANVPQVGIDIDRAKVLKLGIPLSDLNASIGAFLGGAYVNDFNKFGRLYKVFIQAEPEYRDDEKKLGLFFVRTAAGEMVPLSTLARPRVTSGPEYTNRFNLLRGAEVSGAPAPGYSSAQALNALEEVAAEVLPPDMGYAWNAMSFQEQSASGSAGVVFAMALLFVYLILAAQYESWSLPLSVIFGIPFAVFGAFAGLWSFRLFSESYVNNVFAQIALVLLVGLAAKNAILIVEFARVKRDEGLSPVRAALEAAQARFRPILMTAFSFILGVLPLLTASGAGAEARKVMGVAVFFGMLIATLLGICFIPVLFVLVEKVFSGEQSVSNEENFHA